MRFSRVVAGALVLILWGATEASAPAGAAADAIRPAPTSVDRRECALLASAATLDAAPGTTLVTFTLVDPGCG